MSGKLAWMLEISGLPEATQKLRDLDKVTSTVGKGINVGGNDLSKFLNGLNASVLRLNPQLAKLKTQIKDIASTPNPHLATFLNQSLGISAGQNQPNRKSYESFWKRSIPPFMEPPKIPTGGGGSSGGGGRVGRLLGFFGGDEGGKLSTLFAGLGAFRIALWELQPIFRGLRFAMEEFLKTVQRGSRLFTDAAKLGKGTRETYALQSALGALNISPEEANKLALYSQFKNSGGRQSGPFTQPRMATGQLANTGQSSLSSGRGVSTLGDIQGLKNLMPYFDYFTRQTQLSAIAMSDSARDAFEFDLQMKILKSDFEGLAASVFKLADALGGFKNIMASVHGIAMVLEVYLLAKIKELQSWGLIPKSIEAQNQKFGGGNPLLGGGSQWTKMGLIFNGIGQTATDYAKQTAQYTKETAVILKNHFQSQYASGSTINQMGIPLTNNP